MRYNVSSTLTYLHIDTQVILNIVFGIQHKIYTQISCVYIVPAVAVSVEEVYHLRIVYKFFPPGIIKFETFRSLIFVYFFSITCFAIQLHVYTVADDNLQLLP